MSSLGPRSTLLVLGAELGPKSARNKRTREQHSQSSQYQRRNRGPESGGYSPEVTLLAEVV